MSRKAIQDLETKRLAKHRTLLSPVKIPFGFPTLFQPRRCAAKAGVGRPKPRFGTGLQTSPPPFQLTTRTNKTPDCSWNPTLQPRTYLVCSVPRKKKQKKLPEAPNAANEQTILRLHTVGVGVLGSKLYAHPAGEWNVWNRRDVDVEFFTAQALEGRDMASKSEKTTRVEMCLTSHDCCVGMRYVSVFPDFCVDSLPSDCQQLWSLQQSLRPGPAWAVGHPTAWTLLDRPYPRTTSARAQGI